MFEKKRKIFSFAKKHFLKEENKLEKETYHIRLHQDRQNNIPEPFCKLHIRGSCTC